VHAKAVQKEVRFLLGHLDPIFRSRRALIQYEFRHHVQTSLDLFRRRKRSLAPIVSVWPQVEGKMFDLDRHCAIFGFVHPIARPERHERGKDGKKFCGINNASNRRQFSSKFARASGCHFAYCEA
jgi:hypothetical protein